MNPNPLLTLPRRFSMEAVFYDHVPLVWGLLNGERRLFLFDSGGQDLLLNSHYLPPETSTPGSGIMGATGHAGSVYTHVADLSFGEWRFQNFELMAIDLKHLEEELGVEMHGIIGFRHLIHYDWMVDYKAGIISFWDRMVKSEHKILHQESVSYRHHLPLVSLEIAGHPLKFLVDTGAAIVLVDRSKQDLILEAVGDLISEPMRSASITSVMVEAGTLKEFRLGPLSFGPSDIKFSDLSHMRAFAEFDGIVGYPLLSKYRVIQSWSFHGLYFLED